MKRLLLLPIVAALLAGCASQSGSDSDPCEKYVAAYQLYMSSTAGGRVPSKDEIQAAQAAAAYLQLRCGWTAPAARGFRVVDAHGVPVITPH